MLNFILTNSVCSWSLLLLSLYARAKHWVNHCVFVKFCIISCVEKIYANQAKIFKCTDMQVFFSRKKIQNFWHITRISPFKRRAVINSPKQSDFGLPCTGLSNFLEVFCKFLHVFATVLFRWLWHSFYDTWFYTWGMSARVIQTVVLSRRISETRLSAAPATWKLFTYEMRRNQVVGGLQTKYWGL